MGDPPSSGEGPHLRLQLLDVTPDSARGLSGGAGRSRTLTLALAMALPSSFVTSSMYAPASDLSEYCMSRHVFLRVVVTSICSSDVTTILLIDHLTTGFGEPRMGML